MKRTSRVILPEIVEVPFECAPERMGLEPGCMRYRMGRLTIFVGRLPISGEYHLSISHPTRYPTWDEIAEARYKLIPDECTMGLLLPARGRYVNIHHNCFHLYQVKEE